MAREEARLLMSGGSDDLQGAKVIQVGVGVVVQVSGVEAGSSGKRVKHSHWCRGSDDIPQMVAVQSNESMGSSGRRVRHTLWLISDASRLWEGILNSSSFLSISDAVTRGFGTRCHLATSRELPSYPTDRGDC